MMQSLPLKKSMDLISHVLVGNVFKEAGRLNSLTNKAVVVLFAFLPDIPVLLLMYPLLGHANGRPYWIPYNSDWVGVRATHPIWTATWEIPHSLFFLLLVIFPLVFWLKLPRIAIASYLSHILLDLPTHTGEWGVKPLYPMSFIVNGFTDAWAWPFSYMLLSWLVLVVVGLSIRAYLRRKPSYSNRGV